MPRNGPDAVIWQPEHTGASYAKVREKKHNTKNMIRARQVQVQQWQQAHSLYFIDLKNQIAYPTTKKGALFEA